MGKIRTVAESLRVRGGEVELAVSLYGSKKEPVVVLVHGYPDSSRVWHKIIPLLAPRYRVVAYDVRGAGASTAPEATAAYALEHLVADLAAVLDAASCGRPVHLVAHDWGSIQSWEAVCTARLGGRIASFTSISGPSLDHAGHWIQQRLRGGAPGEIAEVANQLLYSWYIGAFHLPLAAPLAWRLGLDRLWPRLLERMEGIREDAMPTQRSDGRHGLKLYRANVRERLRSPRQRRTAVPVQVVVPTRDRFVNVELLDGLEQWVDQLWRREVAAGHWLQLSHPELLARWVGEFVDLHEGGDETAALRRARVGAQDDKLKHAGAEMAAADIDFAARAARLLSPAPTRRLARMELPL